MDVTSSRMNDADLLTLCAFEEANLEPDDGIAAVVQVILNRGRLHYQSDGTVRGTIFHNTSSLSWTSYAMQNGHYEQIAHSPGQMEARAEFLLARDALYRIRWAQIADIVGRVRAGVYHGADYDRLTPDVLLYCDLKLSQPEWATPEKLVCAIHNHSFYKA